MNRATLFVTVLFLGSGLFASAQTTQQQSLGDIARQLREQKAKDAKAPATVITNDTLPASVAGQVINVLPDNAAKPAANDANAKPAEAAETNKEKPAAHDPKSRTREEWQNMFKAARRDLAKAKEVQQLSEDELNLLQIQDARELDAVAKQDLDNKIQSKQSEVDANKATTAAAQKTLDDLEKEFKDSGAPEEWSVTEEPPPSQS
jgi:hypothetical protein